jgi:hypothetical protein
VVFKKSFLFLSLASISILRAQLTVTAVVGVEKSIADLGFSIQDAKFLLNSHHHYDHGGGLSELRTRSCDSANNLGASVDLTEMQNTSRNQNSYFANNWPHSWGTFFGFPLSLAANV